MRHVLLGGALILSALLLPVQAAIEVYQFNSPADEARYKALIEELRCLVCQNQNIADSNADLAQDLRRETYEMIQSGISDREIVDFMVKRYGDFVLYRPPVKSATYALWFGPFLFILGGIGFLVYFIRRRQKYSAPTLTPQEEARLHRLVDDKESQE